MATDKSYYTILTDIGKAKIANASLVGEKVDFVKIQLGDGGGNEYNPTEEQTALKNIEIYKVTYWFLFFSKNYL